MITSRQKCKELDGTLVVAAERRRGRGAAGNPAARFEREVRINADDGWESAAELPPFRTQVTVERPRSIISRNTSPDLGFDRSVNPYRGCEHGCVYCFARPTHAYLGLSPGLDFETRLFAKPDAAALLARELGAAGYECRTMALGTNTDPYQPIERDHRITRSILEVLEQHDHPVGIVTKSDLVVRDRDILARMAAKELAKVAISVTTLDRDLARKMEPRAPTPAKRLDAIRGLSEAGVPVTLLAAPIIPAINDHEIERIVDAAAAAGARHAGYVLLRLPLEISDIFQDWLCRVAPDRAGRVMSLMRGARGGKDYQSAWGLRMRGDGPYAWTIARRFQLAARRAGLDHDRIALRTDLFRPPRPAGRQLDLFDGR